MIKVILICLICLNIFASNIDLDEKKLDSMAGFKLNTIFNKDDYVFSRFDIDNNQYLDVELKKGISFFKDYENVRTHTDIKLNKNKEIKDIFISYSFDSNVNELIKYDFFRFIKYLENTYQIKFIKHLEKFNTNSGYENYSLDYTYSNGDHIKIDFFSNLEKINNIEIAISKKGEK